MTIKLFISLLLLSPFACTANPTEKSYTINDFKRSYFKIISQNSGYYKILCKIEASTNELPIAYGFIDRDFYTDVITVTKDFKAISIYLFNEVQGVFDKTITSAPMPSGETILSVKITYVTQTSDYPNILIVTENKSSNKMFIHAYQITRDQNQLYTLTEITDLLVTVDNGSGNQSVEPINFQISNDSSMTEYWLVVDSEIRTVLSYNRSQSTHSFTKILFTTLLDDTCTGCIDFRPVQNYALVSVGSHLSVDLNGDGRADFILESSKGSTRFLELYTFQNSGKFGLTKTFQIDNNYSIGTWIDIQERKIMDIVFWNKNDNKLYIHSGFVNSGTEILANEQFASQPFDFSIPSLDSSSGVFPLSLNLLPGAKIQENPSLRIFGMVRFADLSLTGYMDLIINTIDADGSNNVHVFQNVPCSDTDSTCRTFKLEYDKKSIGVIQGKNSIQASLFDFGERGFFNQQNRSLFSRIHRQRTRYSSLHQQFRNRKLLPQRCHFSQRQRVPISQWRFHFHPKNRLLWRSLHRKSFLNQANNNSTALPIDSVSPSFISDSAKSTITSKISKSESLAPSISAMFGVLSSLIHNS